FLGRADQQVKVRGLRIELGEIEAALGRHPALREAAVAVREDARGARLLAFVAARQGVEVEPHELRAWLRERLPDPMVPTAWTILAALPLTANGKVDRRALAALAPAAATPGAAALAAPRTPIEGVLAGIWEQVLGRERVDVFSSFFDLGGHSLLATQVVARVRQAFGIELPLRQLFEAPTVALLGAAVEAALRSGGGAVGPPLGRSERHGDAPLSFAQLRLWFLDRLLPGSPAYNVQLALRLLGPLGRAALAKSLGEVVRRHESLRTGFAEVGGEPVQRIRPAAEGWAGLPLVDLSGLPKASGEAEAGRWVAAAAARPFRLGSEPLLRTLLLSLAADHHVVVGTAHHSVSDGWSLELLVEEVAALYQAFAAGRRSPLPELPVQYADYAEWQRRWLTAEVLAEHVGYWRQRLAGAPPVLELPGDRPRPAVQSGRGGSVPVRLGPALIAGVRELSRRHGATPFMTLLAGYQTLLSRLARQRDVCVGTPLAGRTHVEIEGLIGLFVNTLVLRADLGAAGGFGELLAQVRDGALAAHLHQDLPFEKLVEELAPRRSLSHAPLFQAMFALQNVPRRDIEVAGLRMRPIEAAAAAAKFDLTLILSEAADGLAGVLEYDRALFDRATAARWAGHLESVLAAAVADPGCPPGDLPWLGEAERQVLCEWNDTAAALAAGQCLDQLIEAQAARSPEAIAVVCGGESLSYRELDARAG
ncbi:MAG: non-ribosomal peptide synthetase, partial [Acidobacteria bacterium]|nr:non-ribosomal peptide synthetase [Acidobacteriota bacterium]